MLPNFRRSNVMLMSAAGCELRDDVQNELRRHEKREQRSSATQMSQMYVLYRETCLQLTSEIVVCAAACGCRYCYLVFNRIFCWITVGYDVHRHKQAFNKRHIIQYGGDSVTDLRSVRPQARANWIGPEPDSVLRSVRSLALSDSL